VRFFFAEDRANSRCCDFIKNEVRFANGPRVP